MDGLSIIKLERVGRSPSFLSESLWHTAPITNNMCHLIMCKSHLQCNFIVLILMRAVSKQKQVFLSVIPKVSLARMVQANRAGRSPTFWTRGLALLGLAGTRGLASPIEEVLSFKTSPSLPISDQQNHRYLDCCTPTPRDIWRVPRVL